MFQRCSRLAIVALIGSFLAIPATSALAQTGNNPTTNRLEVPVSGPVLKDNAPAGTFNGTFAISRFAIQNSTLVAIGQLSGAVTNGGVVGPTIVTNAAMPVNNASGAAAAEAFASCDTDATAQPACDILNLVLGPLDLNLLGLEIHLNQVVLNITAQPGSGNLLGNLLCAIAGLLDNPPFGQQIVNLLNQLIGILSGL